MNRPCSIIQFHLIPSLLLLSLSLVGSAVAAELPLRTFSASYDLHKGSMHLAITEISLRREGPLWRWRTTTAARGIYAWLVKNRPFTETSFIQADDEFRIQQIVNGDPADTKKHESANFDWDKGRIDVLRKGKRKQLPLDAQVYDYHSIHLLAFFMQLQQLDRTTVDFYRKGKITRSSLFSGGRADIDLNGKTVNSTVFEQDVVKSGSKMKYYYDEENPLLPIRVEKHEHGETSVTLTLREVDWDL